MLHSLVTTPGPHAGTYAETAAAAAAEAATATSGKGSAWNSAGTWEETDVSTWASDELRKR